MIRLEDLKNKTQQNRKNHNKTFTHRDQGGGKPAAGCIDTQVRTAQSCLLFVFISKWNLYTLANGQPSRADTCTQQLPWQSEKCVALKTKALQEHQPPASSIYLSSFFSDYFLLFLLSQHGSGGYSNSDLITVQMHCWQ